LGSQGQRERGRLEGAKVGSKKWAGRTEIAKGRREGIGTRRRAESREAGQKKERGTRCWPEIKSRV